MEHQQVELRRIARSRSLPAGYVFRARLVLILAESTSFSIIRQRLRSTAPIISPVITRSMFTSTSDLARRLRRYINAYSANALSVRWKYLNPLAAPVVTNSLRQATSDLGPGRSRNKTQITWFQVAIPLSAKSNSS
jgi:hypothetical protein